MQGRLSPPVDGHIQAFPGAAWREEFARAAAAGLSCIEWIYGAEREEENPLSSDDGVEEIRRAAVDSGVTVSSVCADYYMVERLVERPSLADHLAALVARSARVGARHVVLPFVDESSLGNAADIATLVDVLLRVAPQTPMELHLETDLRPEEFAALLERIGLPNVRANHDIGNSASLGHDPDEELTVLGPWIGSVHVKDRVRGGGTVPLGTGDADLPRSLRLLRQASFSGPYILQVAREEGISEVELAVRNRLFVESQLRAAA
jgi:L-ribulose-5-phosphate 3-epimerase